METILDYCDGLPKRRFAAGDVLLQEGGTSGRLFIVTAGSFEILKGAYQINTVDEPGAIFGEMSVLLGLPHMATVKALTDAEAYEVEGADGFLNMRSEINHFISKMLAQRLHGMTSYLVDLKTQFEDHSNHLGMVDEVLEVLANQQFADFEAGSDREGDWDTDRNADQDANVKM